MTITWEEIEDSIEDSRRSENAQQFYNFVISIIEENQLTCIDKLLKLRLILIGLPYENRYEIFNLPNIQIILNNFNAKEIVELYGLFLPEDAYKFFKSDFIKDRFQRALLSKTDYEDILSYFKGGIKDSVKCLLNTYSMQHQERNNSEPKGERFEFSEECNPIRRPRI